MSGTFCEAPHPTLEGVRCSRPANHDDDHRSFGFGRTPGYVWALALAERVETPRAAIDRIETAKPVTNEPTALAAVTVKYPAPDAICVVCGARGDNHPARHPFRIAANQAQPAKSSGLSLKDAAALFPPIGPSGTVNPSSPFAQHTIVTATGASGPPFKGGKWFPPADPIGPVGATGPTSGTMFLGVSHPEPAPRPSTGDVWATVIADMRERRETGIAKYGTALQPFNGRDPLVDAYQEQLDGAVYLRQAIIEHDVARKFFADVSALAQQYVGRLADEARCAQFGAEVMRLLGIARTNGGGQ